MSAPKVHLHLNGKRYKVTADKDEPEFGRTGAECPHCFKPLMVLGRNKRIAEDDRAYEADAYARCCNSYVGYLRHDVNTIFGIHEDMAVLHGRCRVY